MSDQALRRAVPVVLTTLVLCAGTSMGGISPYTWAAPVDGFWSDPLNWNPTGVPGPNDQVYLGLTGPYTISLGPSAQDASTFHIANPEAALHITNTRNLRIAQAIINHGRIVLNPNNELRFPSIVMTDGSSISGTGLIRLGASDFRATITGRTGQGDAINHEAGHTIMGMGGIGLVVDNHGVFVADVPDEALVLYGHSYDNHGLFGAVQAGILEVRAPVSQSEHGSILADGPGSRIDFHAAQLTGGSLGSTGGAAVHLLTVDKSLESVRLQGDFVIQPGIKVTLSDPWIDGANFTIDPPSSATTTLRIAAGLQPAEGDITLTSPNHRLETVNGTGPVVLGTGFAIRGSGTIQADAVNHGLIRADQPDAPLTVTHSTIEHHGVIEAVNGGAFVVKESTLTRAPGSSIRATGPGSVVRFEHSSTGGELVSRDGGSILFGSNNLIPRATLDHAVLDGIFQVLPRTNVTVLGSLTNDGELRVLGGADSSGRLTQIVFADGATISGSGTIELVDGDNRLASLDPDAIITLGADQTITGKGAIAVGMIVDGVVHVSEGGDIHFSGSPIVNRGEMRADGGWLRIGGNITNEQGSRIFAENGGQIWLTGYRENGRMFGGSIDLSEDAILRIGTFTLHDVTINGDTSIFQGSRISVAGSFINNGRIFLGIPNGTWSGDLIFETSMTIQGEGAIVLPHTYGPSIEGTSGVVAALGPGQRLEGIGIVNVPLTAHGPVAPGLDGVGMLLANVPFTFSPTATLEIEVGPVSTDHFWTREVHLDGTLDIRFIDGFSPGTPYWHRTFMSAANHTTGAFHTINGPDLPDPRLEYRVTYAHPYFTVGTYCKADINADQQLNFFDVSTFINIFNAGDPVADIAAPFGTVNFFDLSAYINRFNAGCP